MTRLDWRFRRRSLSDPIKTAPCGCRYDCYSEDVVRYCEKHYPIQQTLGRAMKRKEIGA